MGPGRRRRAARVLSPVPAIARVVSPRGVSQRGRFVIDSKGLPGNDEPGPTRDPVKPHAAAPRPRARCATSRHSTSGAGRSRSSRWRAGSRTTTTWSVGRSGRSSPGSASTAGCWGSTAATRSSASAGARAGGRAGGRPPRGRRARQRAPRGPDARPRPTSATRRSCRGSRPCSARSTTAGTGSPARSSISRRSRPSAPTPPRRGARRRPARRHRRPARRRPAARPPGRAVRAGALSQRPARRPTSSTTAAGSGWSTGSTPGSATRCSTWRGSRPTAGSPRPLDVALLAAYRGTRRADPRDLRDCASQGDVAAARGPLVGHPDGRLRPRVRLRGVRRRQLPRLPRGAAAGRDEGGMAIGTMAGRLA